CPTIRYPWPVPCRTGWRRGRRPPRRRTRRGRRLGRHRPTRPLRRRPPTPRRRWLIETGSGAASRSPPVPEGEPTSYLTLCHGSGAGTAHVRGASGEGVAARRVTRVEPGAEPLLTFGRGAMGERLAPGARALDGVVAHGFGGVDGLVEVPRLEPALDLLGPEPCEAVGLQFHLHRQRIGFGLRRRLLFGAHLVVYAEEVLDVVPVLVGQHVGHGEVAFEAELLFEPLV